jgi:predicted lysophospholipase L1 biosynthesis ABC-type transport system permease subunit
VRVGDEAVTIVGVAADARYVEVGEALRPMLYRPLAQAPGDVLADELTVLTRAPGRPATALVPELRAAVRALDRHVPVLDARSFDDALARQLLPQQLAAALLGAYGALTLVLGAVGLYGVIAYAVEQRTREFGVRIALGAPRGHLLGAVLRHGARLVAIGLGIGLALAAGVGQVLASFLFGVGGTDPMALGGGALVLGLVALGAVYVPAWRATRLDAVRALRAE